MAKNTTSKLGVWAFIVGVILALVGGVIVGLLNAGETVITAILIVLGLVVGFLNVTDKETKDYLLASVSLILVTYFGGATLGMVPVIGSYLSSVFSAIMTFVIPATIVVALKAIYNLAQD
ncbi:MAG: hypothetical protein WC758_01395 [Candidatus Woesearchaeota archaeon]|jgi:hypothetical protein